MILVDTSAFYALLCREDQDHDRVREFFDTVTEPLLTTSYVLSETMGIVQHRLGWKAVAGFVSELMPHLEIAWIGAGEHADGWVRMQQRPARHMSIVDATAMAVMQPRGIRRCLTLDPEFRRQGFQSLP